MSEETERNKGESHNDEKVIYELGYHIISSIGEEVVSGETQNIKESIEKESGIFILEEPPSPLKLAYPFTRTTNGKTEKYDTTFFGWIKFELSLGKIGKIKEVLDSNKNILRFLIIKTVREDTRVSKNIMSATQQPKEANKVIPSVSVVKKAEEKPEPVVDKDLDRTIESLVVE